MYLHHDGSPLYVSNAAPRLGEFISLRLRTHRDHQPERVVLRTVHDGEPYVVVAEEKEAVGTDVWWVVTIQARNVVTHYRWLLSGGAYSYAWLTASGLVDHDVPDADDFAVVALPPPPAWARQAVVYQVFPDRFARRRDAEQVDAITEQYGAPVPDWAQPRRWDAHPDGRSASTPVEFFGGDLDGVREHLDHLQDLGATTLYLTPVFPARSTHRYDAASFDEIDPLLGGDRALADLNAEAHRRGLRVIGDITLNHCGKSHDWFVRAQDPDAPERGYFRFDPDAPHGYLTWLGVGSLPKFDLTSEGLREVLVRRPDSAIRRWIGGATGFDGWRVDVANMAGRMGEVDVTLDLAREVREAMTHEGDDLLLVAEHAHDASDDLRGDGWHGTMNYQGFTRQVWSWLRAPEFHETFLGLPVEVPVITGGQMVASMRAFHGRMPWRSLTTSWNILGSHDSARIRTVVGTQERQIAALGLAIGLPGVPMVFAGDEFGATGSWGEDARTTIDWAHPPAAEASLLEAYRQLLRLRATSPSLAAGGLRWVDVADDSVAFLREHPTERLLLVVARGQSQKVRIPLAEFDLARVVHVHGFTAQVEAGHAVIDIPHAGVGIWRVS